MTCTSRAFEGILPSGAASGGDQRARARLSGGDVQALIERGHNLWIELGKLPATWRRLTDLVGSRPVSSLTSYIATPTGPWSNLKRVELLDVLDRASTANIGKRCQLAREVSPRLEVVAHLAAQHTADCGRVPDRCALMYREFQKSEARLLAIGQPFVAWVLYRHFKMCPSDDPDRFQAGMIGLRTALGRYNADEGTAFSTFALPYCLGMMRRDALSAPPMVSLDTDAGPADLVVDDMDKVQEDCDHSTLRAALAGLPQQDRDMLNAAFGLDGGTPHSVHVFAHRAGIDAGTARAQMQRVLATLREQLGVAA